MKTQYDFIIIGAGPAGMAAAIEAGRSGLSTIVLGDQRLPGGQVYRAIERVSADNLDMLGADYRDGRELTREFRMAAIDYVPGAAIWQVDPDWIVSFIFEDSARQVKGQRILVATGAREFKPRAPTATARIPGSSPSRNWKAGWQKPISNPQSLASS